MPCICVKCWLFSISSLNLSFPVLEGLIFLKSLDVCFRFFLLSKLMTHLSRKLKNKFFTTSHKFYFSPGLQSTHINTRKVLSCVELATVGDRLCKPVSQVDSESWLLEYRSVGIENFEVEKKTERVGSFDIIFLEISISISSDELWSLEFEIWAADTRQLTVSTPVKLSCQVFRNPWDTFCNGHAYD